MRAEGGSGPDDQTRLSTSDDQPPGRVLDSYRLIRMLGQGGMGEVWLAEQLEPVRRRVAVKILKSGMDTRQVLARFDAERQALAIMSHPAVAKVFDAGSTETGSPYFVMEYVHGEAITAYCNHARLTISERIQLFLRVCEGVHHAHQKGIIHRDLKPSNVLVTVEDDRPSPKIIDFGVAKPLAQRLADASLVTEFGMLIGTPEYMSPEQAEMGGLDIDIRTDVYALGLLLYELVAGALPFDSTTLREKGIDELRRFIREVDAPRPSTRVTSLGPRQAPIAEQRRTDPARLVRELRGDLDAIILTALEKDRARRYSSVWDFALDLQRLLRDEPVLARTPSTTYRIGKFVRRHRLGVAVASSVLALLVAFAVSVTVQSQRVAAERDRANREAETARQVSDFLVGLFDVSDPSEARGNSVTAREILDAGARRIRAELATEPAIQGRLLATLGAVYRKLGLYTDADGLTSSAVDVTRTAFGDESVEHLAAIEELATLRYLQGRWEESESLFRDVVAESQRLYGPDDDRTYRAQDGVARALFGQGRSEEAESMHRVALEGLMRLLGPEHDYTMVAMNSLAAALFEQRKYAEAEGYFREAYALRLRVSGEDHPATLIVLGNLGAVLAVQKKTAEAEQFYRSALETSRRVLGSDNPFTIRRQSNLGELLLEQNKLPEAEASLGETVQLARRVWPNGHTTLAIALRNLAALRNRQLRYADAEALAKEALGYFQANFPVGHQRIAQAELELGTALLEQQRFVEAEPLLLAAEAASRNGALETSSTILPLIRLYETWGKPADVAVWQQKLEAASRSTQP